MMSKLLRARALLPWLVAMFACACNALAAEQVCKTTTLKNPALTLAEMYALADGHAKAWKSDAVG